jgi:hypothetical protein
MRWPLNVGASIVVSTGQTVCPRCGLRMDVVDMGERPDVRYDFPAWDKLCLEPELGGPSACLEMQRQTLRRALASAARPGKH